MRKFIGVAAAVLAATAAFTACGEKNPFGATEFSVEYGESFAIPEIEQDYDVSVTDPSGKPVALRYGSFIPKVGTYKVVCTVGGKDYELKVVCADTVAPKVRFEKHVIDAEAGDTVSIPALLTDDKSGIQFYYYVFYLYKQLGIIGGKGIGIQGLSTKALGRIILPVPPLNEQRQILNKISIIFDNMKGEI